MRPFLSAKVAGSLTASAALFLFNVIEKKLPPGPMGRRTAKHVEADTAGWLWFHGGNLHQSRHYSQVLSLQLKARMEGIPTPVYGLQKVHHLG